MHVIALVSIALCSLSAVAPTEHREPCRPPPLTHGTLHVTGTKGVSAASGEFSYDSHGRKLHFTDSHNKTDIMDVLILFDENVFYEIDSQNQSCKKRHLRSHIHAMEIPHNATHIDESYLGSEYIGDQGVRMRTWQKTMTELKGILTVSTTSCGCMTLTASVFFESGDVLLFSFMDVETEVKDPHVFEPPSFCEELQFEETDENHFFEIFDHH
ncbi:ependymin [Denticeps clupeoides]|uniref:Ependymin n=1 Tax=Denticeps clupeoides TaxID=299321 RepID=A0A8C4AW27_9TELE|nr:ependymin-like [Denticeps clupeoides]XP_028840158.1 ependymin-like [Denticeps clupeoides]